MYFAALILIILLNLIKCLLCEPKVFKFRNRYDVLFHSQETSNDVSTAIRMFNNTNEVDYFRLLGVGADHLMIGAADVLYNISTETFKNVSVYNWTPGPLQYKDCIMKSVNQHACHNYIRILAESSDGNFIICGTNAYKPQCRILDHGMERILSEFSGTGLSPLDPQQNTTVHMDGHFLYAATVADFAGMDSLIFRRNISASGDRGLRTQRSNDLLLNKPQFVGELHTHEHVYFFFREEANEADTISTYSRVARVCKSDRGGPRNYYEAEWTSFVKARLNCSIPEKNRPFYFDEIISISKLLTAADGRKIFYATFVSEFNFLRHSVICAFELAEIETLFAQSDVLVMDTDRTKKKWMRKTREDRIAKLVGQCQPDSRRLSEDDAIQLRRYSLLADSATNIFSHGAVGIHRGSDHYNQVVVLQGVQFHEGTVDVLYVATDQGNVIKMVNLAAFSTYLKVKLFASESSKLSTVSTEDVTDPLIPVAIFDVSKLPIRSLLISGGKHLIVVTDLAVYRFPLHICSIHSTCRACVESRDPHCVWHNFECTHMKKIQKRFAYQDVLARRADICREIAAQDDKEFRNYDNPPLSSLQINVSSYARHNANYTSYYHSQKNVKCECENNKATKIANGECLCIAGDDQEWSGKELGSFSRRQIPSETFPINATFFDQFQSLFPSMRSANVASVPQWILLIIGFAIAQTVGFLYLCCKLYVARRKRWKCSTTTVPSVVLNEKNKCAHHSLQNCGESTCIHSTANLSLYLSPTMASTLSGTNYSNAQSEFITAYSPHSLLSGTTTNVMTREASNDTKSNQNFSTQNLNCNHYYRKGIGSTQNCEKVSNCVDHYNRSTINVSPSNRHGISFFAGSDKGISYRLTDENAAALATSTLNRIPAAANCTSFYNVVSPYRNVNTLDSRASGRRQISRTATFNHDRAPDQPTIASFTSSASSTMLSASTNVTHLSSFYCDSDIMLEEKSTLPINSTLPSTDVYNTNTTTNNEEEDICIKLDGSTSTATAISSYSPNFFHLNAIPSQIALNLSRNSRSIQQINPYQLRNQRKPLAHLQKTSSGVIIRA